MGQHPLAAINARAAQLNGGGRGGGSGVQRRGGGREASGRLTFLAIPSTAIICRCSPIAWAERRQMGGDRSGTPHTPPDSSLCWGAGHRVSIVAQKASRPRREAPHPARVAGQTGGGGRQRAGLPLPREEKAPLLLAPRSGSAQRPFLSQPGGEGVSGAAASPGTGRTGRIIEPSSRSDLASFPSLGAALICLLGSQDGRRPRGASPWRVPCPQPALAPGRLRQAGRPKAAASRPPARGRAYRATRGLPGPPRSPRQPRLALSARAGGKRSGTQPRRPTEIARTPGERPALPAAKKAGLGGVERGRLSYPPPRRLSPNPAWGELPA